MFWIETPVHLPECIENFAPLLIYLVFYKAYKDGWNGTQNTRTLKAEFVIKISIGKFQLFCFPVAHELPKDKSLRHTLKPTDISGSTKRINSFFKTEFSVDFHDVPSISRFSLALANSSCFCFRYDYRQTKRPPHSLSCSRSSTLSNQLISRVLKSVWRRLKQ